MPQPSYYYASGRVGVARRTALHGTQLERLSAAHTYEDAKRALTEIGFATADSADFLQAADRHVQAACALIKAVSPDPLVTDSLLLRYDIHNLKVLYKSRYLAQKPQFLSRCGTLDVEHLRHAVMERTYSRLPQHLKAAMELIEKRSAVRFDPMLVDTELDKGMYRQIFANLAQSSHAAVVKRYFEAKADITNVIMLLRIKAMGKGMHEFAEIMLPGGHIALHTLKGVYSENDRLARTLRRYSAPLYQAVLAASVDTAKLPYLEKVADDYLALLFRNSRFDTASIEMLAHYLLMRQREATDVRLIMAGKQNGFAPEAVMERVRELGG